MLWVKTFHIVFMVSWYAGLLYLPRLFVYHATTEDPPGRVRFETMERRLFLIMTVGALGTLVFGAWLIGYLHPAIWEQGWIHAKLTLVGVLLVFHVYCARIMADFRRHRNTKSQVFFRVFNEIPALALIAIVALVVVRPF